MNSFLLCASHSAEKIHTDTALDILNKIDCQYNDLEWGAHPAHHLPTRHSMLKQNVPFSNLHNNCSGKHVGMLALSKTLGIKHSSIEIIPLSKLSEVVSILF